MQGVFEKVDGHLDLHLSTVEVQVCLFYYCMIEFCKIICYYGNLMLEILKITQGIRVPINQSLNILFLILKTLNLVFNLELIQLHF